MRDNCMLQILTRIFNDTLVCVKLEKIEFMAEFHVQIKLKTSTLFMLIWLFLLCHGAPASTYDRRTPVVQAVHLVGAAVVNISSEYQTRASRQPFRLDPFFDNFFRDFFEARPQKRTSLGSGVIIDGRRGYILTNAHVIEKGAVIKVLLRDEREFEGRIVGVDADSDLAVLQIQSDAELPAVPMGNSDDLMIGEAVIAIGNPFGFSHTVTTGVISALDRSIRTDDRVFHNFIQTDASINPGNSGGPLLNINGELIGINTAIYAKAQGIGFAIPIDKAKRIVTDLIQYGHVVQAWIGLRVQDADPRLAQYLDLGERVGAVVTQIEDQSPAEAAGVKPGDLLMRIDRTKLESSSDYEAAIRALAAGDTVEVLLWRNAEQKKITIKTAAYPLERAPELAFKRMGIKVAELDTTNRQRYTVVAEQGVVIVGLRPESYPARIGVATGDVLREIDGQTIARTDDFYDAVIKARRKSAVVILLQRQDQLYYVTLQLAP
jgi:Do/DeqQ family serine protease